MSDGPTQDRDMGVTIMTIEADPALPFWKTNEGNSS